MRKTSIVLSLLTGSILYAQSSTLEELGYISAMELTFAGMSYIATQDQWHGEKIAGGFDVIMAVGGLKKLLTIKSQEYIQLVIIYYQLDFLQRLISIFK